MAFTAGKSKEIEGKSNDWLLDQSLMQSMQDRFCDANNVYMVCLNAQNGVVTKAYGTKEELEYVYSKAGRERHVSLLDKMTGHSIESVVEEPLDTDSIKMSGVAIHVSGETIAVWIVIGIMGFGYSMAGIYPTTVSFAGNLIEKYPIAWSFILTIASIGSIVMPSIIGKIAETAGIFYGMGSIVIVVFIDMVCILALVRYLKKQNQ